LVLFQRAAVAAQGSLHEIFVVAVFVVRVSGFVLCRLPGE